MDTILAELGTSFQDEFAGRLLLTEVGDVKCEG
jgi:hypothetical protein